MQIERLIPGRCAARLDLAVEVAVLVHVQRPDPLVSLVEENFDLDNILRLVEVVLDPAPVVVVEDVSLARPARVDGDVLVSGVLGYAAVRAAAKFEHSVVVVTVSGHSDGRPDARVNEGWGVPAACGHTDIADREQSRRAGLEHS